MFWELPEVSLLGTIRVFCSNAESPFGCGIFRTLCSVLWLFTSCIWDVLRYRILGKKQLLIFSETWSSSFWIVCNCFDDFRTNPPRKQWAISPKGKYHLSKTTFSTFQKCLLVLSFAFFFCCNWKICFENFLRSLYLEQYVFFVQLQSQVLAALFFPERYVR